MNLSRPRVFYLSLFVPLCTEHILVNDYHGEVERLPAIGASISGTKRTTCWLKVSNERKAEVKWLDVSIDLQRSSPMRQLYIYKMLFLNDKRQAVTSSGNGHVQLVSRFLRFIFIEHAKIATQILEMFLRRNN